MSPLPNSLQSLRFIRLGTGGFGAGPRLRLVHRLVRAHLANRGKTATSFGEQLVLIEAVLRIPREMPGAIAEFGCYKGMSSVALSLAAKLTGRRLLVFDSFEGLPEPGAGIHHLGTHQRLDYKKGDYAGSLEDVRTLIARHGEIACCEFVRGFFADTLKLRPPDETYALIFEDADLVASVADVLRHAWPKLADGGLFFSHEARDLEVVKLFFDDAHWSSTHGTLAPGLVGAGLGLPIDGMKQAAFAFAGKKSKGSCLGYTVKRRP
ncbi:MAG: class I SAM-dependent methyltransferase [Opitutaceae bacterium]|nr:class I SAM-dependent methyltransferase [Opitutaceae bacterium]